MIVWIFYKKRKMGTYKYILSEYMTFDVIQSFIKEITIMSTTQITKKIKDLLELENPCQAGDS